MESRASSPVWVHFWDTISRISPGRPLMFAILLAALLPFADPLQPKLTPQQQQRIEQAKASFEIHRQAALRLNDMAQSIQSEADARKFVDGIEEELFGHRGPIPSKLQSWITHSMRRRVARAEFAAV